MRANTMRVLKTVACLLTLGLSGRAFAAPESGGKQIATDSVTGSPSAVALVSVLQVTGTTNSFTISAQHADVASLLKLVFDQAHRQFVPDGSVTGDVTFALTGQKFDTVLEAVCRQAFLRYTVDRNNIYQFRRDDEALRNLLLKTRLINSVLQDQLQRMGYSVPTGMGDIKNDKMQTKPANDAGKRGAISADKGARGQGFAEASAGRALSGGFGGGGGSLGTGGGGAGSFGGGQSADYGPIGQTTAQLNRALPAPAMKSKAGGSQAHDEAKDSKNVSRSKADTTLKADINSAGAQGEAGPAGPAGVADAAGMLGAANRAAQLNADHFGAAVPNLDNNDQYQQFLKQNNFVAVNTHGRIMSMRDILTDLSRQSGVPILIDPDVPKGDEFAMISTITARPLREMLNILAYKGRLEWRWVNNRIFITTTPQLQVFLRGMPLPAPGSAAGGITILPQNSAPASSPATDKKKE